MWFLAASLLLIPLELHTPFLAQGHTGVSLGHVQCRHWFADYQADVFAPGSPCACYMLSVQSGLGFLL